MPKVSGPYIFNSSNQKAFFSRGERLESIQAIEFEIQDYDPELKYQLESGIIEEKEFILIVNGIKERWIKAGYYLPDPEEERNRRIKEEKEIRKDRNRKFARQYGYKLDDVFDATLEYLSGDWKKGT